MEEKLKIAFWSNCHKRGGVTSNLACMATMAALSGTGKSILLENHFNPENLGSILVAEEKKSFLQERAAYYDKYGIDYVLKRLYTGEDGEMLVRQAGIPLLYSNLLYLPQNYIVNKEVFEYEFELVHRDLFACLRRICDTVFVDTESNRNLSTHAILEEADLIVVNLAQDLGCIQDFFENYQSIQEKCIFLIGQYQPEWKIDQMRIRREFHIPRSRLAVIPYNLDFQDAMRQGKVIQYLNLNNEKASHPDNQYFMREVRNAYRILRENMLRIRHTLEPEKKSLGKKRERKVSG